MISLFLPVPQGVIPCLSRIHALSAHRPTGEAAKYTGSRDRGNCCLGTGQGGFLISTSTEPVTDVGWPLLSRNELARNDRIPALRLEGEQSYFSVMIMQPTSDHDKKRRMSG